MATTGSSSRVQRITDRKERRKELQRLLTQPIVASESQRQRDIELARISEMPGIRFKPRELYRLMQRFGLSDTHAKISRADFRQFVIEDLDVDDLFIIDSIWRVIDNSKVNAVELVDFARHLSTMLKGTYEELLRFCFKVYDLSGSERTITRDNARLLLKYALQSEMEELDADGGDSTLNFLLDLTFKKLTSGGDATQVTFAQYERAVREEPLLMECFGQVLPFPEVVDSLLQELATP
eukprot:a178348_16.p1 GENE.a178348_16~~a178348_16.p1  ORF type:complete len:248 (-),score=114.45 a178348_16:266-979(-)